MRRSRLFPAALVAGSVLILSLFGSALSQQTATSTIPNSPRVALIDVGYIFKNHSRFKRMRADITKTAEQAEAQIRQKNQEIRQMMERLGQLNAGTRDYVNLDRKITEAKASLQANVHMKKKEFVQEEAKIYHDVYQEISREVGYYAQAKNIDLVLQFDGEPVDPQDPDSVARSLYKPVVWQASGLNISDVILGQLNRRAAPAGADSRSRPGVYNR